MKNKELVDVNKYKYARMYSRFTKESNPSVCVTGCFDVTNLYKRKSKHKFNAMLCYCILHAAQNIDEFHYSIGEDKNLYYYKNVKTNAVVNGKDGSLYYGDYKYCATFKAFEKEYDRVNDFCENECQHYRRDTGALISTSAIINYPFTSFSINVSDTFWDHFLLWGKYIEQDDKVVLNITLRFHHALIDGQHAGIFFNELQKQINEFKC